MIHLKQISKHFNTQKNGKTHRFCAIQPTNLHIKKGETFGLMGYSGAGKSTLLRMINLLERPDVGQVLVDGQNLTTLNTKQLRSARHHIGMVFQQFNLMNNRTVFDNIKFNLDVAKFSGDKDDRVWQCLRTVGLSERAHHYPAELSGGQKQRVGIARAIATKPKVLLCDEPTSALDPATTKSLLDTLKKISAESGITIVIVTHEMHVIETLCTRTALLHEGNLLEVADIENGQILANTDIGKALLAH